MFFRKKLRYASVPRIVIERASTRTRVTIWTSRPGIVIGRKGQELDSLEILSIELLEKMLGWRYKKLKSQTWLHLLSQRV